MRRQLESWRSGYGEFRLKVHSQRIFGESPEVLYEKYTRRVCLPWISSSTDYMPKLSWYKLIWL